MKHERHSTARHLRFEAMAACGFSDAIEHAERHFRSEAPEVLWIPLAAGPLRLRIKRRMARGIVVSLDDSDRVRRHEALHLRLNPIGGAPFPALRCDFTVRPHMPPGTLIALDIAYNAPLNGIGRAFDAIVGRRFADALGRNLLAQLSAYLEARASAFPAAGAEAKEPDCDEHSARVQNAS